MAWIKNIEDSSTGVVASYWEVISVYYNHKKQESLLEVGGWVSEQAYVDGKNPIMNKAWQIPSGLAPELASGAVAFVSGYAKQQPEFEGWEAP